MTATPGKMQLTIKFSELPPEVEVQEDENRKFEVDCGGRRVAIAMKPKMFRKIEQAQKKYPLWVAAVEGSMGEFTENGFVLDNPNVQVFERKPKLPKKTAAG